MTNVVRLKPRTARKKDSARPAGRKHVPTADTRLIRHCIAYAQAESGFRGGLDVSPNVCHNYAGPAGRKLLAAAEKSLKHVAGIRAINADGLQAKARVFLNLLKFDGENLDYMAAYLVRSFAEDVNRDCNAILDREPAKSEKTANERSAS